MVITLKILFVILAYLVGSIPFGLIIAKVKNVDLRTQGSNNIGAANAGRVLGKKFAILTFIFDMLKGALFVALFKYNVINSDYMLLSPSFYGFIACIGHCYPIFLKFKGGKAVATGSGMIFAYFPYLSVLGILTFIIVVKICRIAAVGSLVSGLVLVLSSFLIIIFSHGGFKGIPMTDIYFMIFTILIFLLVIYKHIPNIKRMINKKENKF